MQIVLADPRFDEFLADNPFHVIGVVPLAPDRVGISIEFDDPPAPGSWPPMDACEPIGSEGPATGLDFEVDLAAQRFGVSPRWGDVSCTLWAQSG